jgi:hypothetical protein
MVNSIRGGFESFDGVMIGFEDAQKGGSPVLFVISLVVLHSLVRAELPHKDEQ